VATGIGDLGGGDETRETRAHDDDVGVHPAGRVCASAVE